MKTQQDPKTGNDTIIIVILVEALGLLFVCFNSSLGILWRLAIITNLLLSPLAGLVGKDRKIGFIPVFFLSVLLSPLIAFVFALSSSKIEDEEYKDRMLKIAESNNNNSSIADQLYKLNELRKEGILSEEEFAQQKEKLLNES